MLYNTSAWQRPSRHLWEALIILILYNLRINKILKLIAIIYDDDYEWLCHREVRSKTDVMEEEFIAFIGSKRTQKQATSWVQK
jgi:hypothetical protein